MNTAPSIFQPMHPAPWWDPSSITPVNLGWWITAFLVAGIILGAFQDWLSDRWEITCCRPRIIRRWYCTRARVILRGTEDGWSVDRYVVLCRDDENTAVPWLKVHKLNAKDLRYWDEDAEPFWAPVTDFAPCEVRRLRPRLLRLGRVRLPWPVTYLPLRQPSGYLEGAR